MIFLEGMLVLLGTLFVLLLAGLVITVTVRFVLVFFRAILGIVRADMPPREVSPANYDEIDGMNEGDFHNGPGGYRPGGYR